MIELYAFTKIPNEINPDEANCRSLKIPLDLDSSRILKNISFIDSIYTNKRFEDSTGTLQTINFSHEWARKAVVFNEQDVKQMWDEYSTYSELRLKNRILPHPIEAQLATFIKMCVDEKLELVSVSHLIFQEYE